MTEGMLASDNETYPYLLDRWTPRTSFLNTGTPGYGTAQELLLYRDIASWVDHDLVVLGYYLGNDARNNVETVDPRRPRFEVVDGELVLVHEPRNESASANVTRDDAGREHGIVRQVAKDPTVRTVRAGLRQHSELYRFVFPKLKALLVESGTYTPPRGQELRQQLTVTRALLETMGSEADERGAKLVIVSIPERGEVDPDSPHLYEKETGEPYWDSQRAMLRELASNSDTIDLVTLRSSLVEEHRRGTRIYGSVDAHLDEEGYRVAAIEVFEHLRASGYLEAASDVDYQRTYPVQATCEMSPET
jgi:hypothetical protein